MSRATDPIEVLQQAAPAGLALSTEQWQAIRCAYDEPHRHYHTLKHLCAMQAHFTEVQQQGGWTHPRAVYLALLFHDLVYDPARKDNEAQSAQRMRQLWTPPPGEPSAGLDLEQAVRLIELTAQHGSLDPSELDTDALLFLDIDMSILATPAAVYQQYEAQIEAEYRPIYPGPLFQLGRAQFLRETLAAGSVFLSRRYRERWEGTAQRNMRMALQRLEASSARS